jgi:porin
MGLPETKDVILRRGKRRPNMRKRRRCIYGFLLTSVGTMLCAQQPSQGDTAATLSLQLQAEQNRPPARSSEFLRQELDSYIRAQAIDRPNPLLRSQPLDEVPDLVTQTARWLFDWESIKLGLTYTLLNQYAVDTPESVRHNQASGRFDLTGAMPLYDKGSTAGSFSLLVRGSTNIGISQQFNLSDALGSTTLINCLSGYGAARPISLNLLYYRQDFLHKRLSFYVGKIHPNQHITLSMFNNDERNQFLNGMNDGSIAVPSDGAWTGGAAMEYQATQHVYVHAVTADTEGSQQSNIATLADKKYMNAVELGWFSGSPGNHNHVYRVTVWRDDTRTSGSGHGMELEFDHEFANGLVPFGRFGYGTSTGTSLRMSNGIGLADKHPFGRRGDMLAAALTFTRPSDLSKPHENIFESFYRLRLTQHTEIGPDIQVLVHPSNSPQLTKTVILNARMRIFF